MRSIDTQISWERVRLSRTHFDCESASDQLQSMWEREARCVSIAPRVAADERHPLARSCRC